MKRYSSKIFVLAGMLIALFVLSGCGLNQRSASESDPVPVNVQVTDPNAGQTENPDPVQPTNNDEGTTGGNEGESGTDTGTTDPAQPAEGGENSGGENPDPAVEPEAPREEEPAPEQPAAEEPAPVEPVAEEPAPEQPAAEEPTPAPATEAPSTDSAAGSKHTVQAGETLFTIALRYGLTVEELAIANNIANVNVLSIGQELSIPAAGTVEVPQTASVHIVAYGDTIFNIAQRYGLTVEELALHNNIANVNRIDIGQEIKIPSSDGK